MTKKQVGLVLIACIIASWIFNVFFGEFLEAKISTSSFLSRWHILSPQAPIVITNRETVRVDNTGDSIAASQDIKSKISTIVLVGNNSDSVTGTAINLTSDGDFVTASQSFAQSSGNYFIVLNDGRSAKIILRTLDPATSLVFFKASINNVPTVDFASSKDEAAGDQVIFVSNSLQNYMTRASLTTVSSVQADVSGKVFQSDLPRGVFGFVPVAGLLSGQPLITNNAKILGIWNGNSLISSDTLKQAVSLYFSNTQKITRPSFSFSYEILTKNESSLTGFPEGALVKDVQSGPAKIAGLLAGDIITKVDNSLVSETANLEEILQSHKPNDKVNLSVTRKNQNINLTLITGELH